MADIKLGDLYLSKEESKDIIEFLAKRRNIKNYYILKIIRRIR